MRFFATLKIYQIMGFLILAMSSCGIKGKPLPPLSSNTVTQQSSSTHLAASTSSTLTASSPTSVNLKKTKKNNGK